MSDRTASSTVAADEKAWPQISTQSKFMQQYRAASPLEMTRAPAGDTYAFASAPHGVTGDVHIFTIGAGGKVWDIYPDSSVSTGYQIFDTGLIGDTIAANTYPDGIGIWAALGNKLSYRRFGAQWSSVQPVTVPASLTGKISRILVDGRSLFQSSFLPAVALVATRGGGDGSDREIYATIGRPPSVGWYTYTPDIPFDARTVSFYWPPDSTDHHPRILVSSSSVYAGPARIWNFVNYGTAAPWGPTTFGYRTLERIAKQGTPDALFSISIPGNLCLYHSEFTDFKPVTQRRKYVSAQFAYDADHRIHAFLVSEPGQGTSGDLYHTVQSPANPSEYVTPTLIYPNVASFTVPRNADGDLEVFLVDSASEHLVHMFWDDGTSSWQTQTIEIPKGVTDKVEEYISYSTDVTFRDTAGAPLIDAAVTISSSEQAAVTVNGVTLFVNPHRTLPVNTNGAGVLSITQETGSLGVPALKLHVPSFMQPGEVCTIEQYADGPLSLESRLEAVTNDELKNARDANKEPLLKASFRDSEDNLTALSSSFHSLMKLPDREKQRAGTVHRLLSRQGPSRGVHIGSEEESVDRLRLTDRDDLPCWSLAFVGGGAAYRALTRDEAQAQIAEIEAQLAAGGFAEWLGSLGDFIRGVADGFVSGINWIVQGTRRVLTFVVDQITYVFDRIVQFVQEAFEMVEAILVAAVESVAQFFEKTFEWLGFLFNWPDILRTRDVLSYVIEQGFEFLREGTPGIKGVIDGGFANVQRQAGNWFDDAIRSVTGDGTTSLGRFGNENTHRDDDMASALGNNVVLNGMVTNQQGITSSRPMLAMIAVDEPNDLLQEMTAYATNLERDPKFRSATQYYEGVAGSADQFFDQALKTLLEKLTELTLLAISGTRSIVGKVLDQMRAVLDSIEQLIKQPIEIPFVSELYTSVSGGHALTTLDLIALVGAVPTTLLYKLLADDEAPFPSEQSFVDFKAQFSAASLLRASGLAPHLAGPVADRIVGMVDAETARKVGFACAAMTAIFGDLTAILDLLASQFSEATWYKGLSLGALVLELALQLTSCPWITTTGLPCDHVQDKDATRGIWIFEWTGFALDAVFFGVFQCLPENVNRTKGWNLVGVTVAWVYGAADMLIRGYAISLAENTWDGIGSFLPTVPAFFKFLLYDGLVKACKYMPLIVTGLDVVAYNASAGIMLLNTKKALQADRAALVPAG